MIIDLKKKLPNEIFNIVKAIGRTADDKKVKAYLVGGPVRDILLRRKNYDMDFVIESDAIKFSRFINKKFKGRVKEYAAFRTATISLKGIKLDIVSARKESYKKPGAYPTVKLSSIEDDLFRRDFTINAMAVTINKKNFGELVDFYNGHKDLKKKVIRIMHDKSFIDDPTRIFRAVRFSVRFKFKIEPCTAKLMREAILGGFLGDVNRGRIKKEIELFLEEEKPLKCLRKFSKLA